MFFVVKRKEMYVSRQSFEIICYTRLICVTCTIWLLIIVYVLESCIMGKYKEVFRTYYDWESINFTHFQCLAVAIMDNIVEFHYLEYNYCKFGR